MVKKKQSQNNSEKNILEQFVFVISSLLVLSVIVYLTILSVNYKLLPPDLSVKFKEEPTVNNKNIYHIWLYNNGGETAENVKIELELFRNNKSVEKSELDIQFSPKKSIREGWITFSGSPTASDSVVARVLSYKKP